MGGNNQSHVKKGDTVIIEINDPDVINMMQASQGESHLELTELMLSPGVIRFQMWGSSLVYTRSGRGLWVNTDLLKKFSDSQCATKTKMIIAVTLGATDVVRRLISSVGSNEVCRGISCLALAVVAGHLDVVKLLLDNNADINFKDGNGNTALHCAVRENQVEICQLLVDRGADVNIKNADQLTPMMISVKLKDKEIFNILISQENADLNLGDADNNTVLHLATEHLQSKVVKALIRNGADIAACNKDGNTPVHLATIAGNFQ